MIVMVTRKLAKRLAARLVDGGVLLREVQKNGPVLLKTGAKLLWNKVSGEYYVGGYMDTGEDVLDAVKSAGGRVQCRKCAIY
jgi:hypothetical protein